MYMSVTIFVTCASKDDLKKDTRNVSLQQYNSVQYNITLRYAGFKSWMTELTMASQIHYLVL